MRGAGAGAAGPTHRVLLGPAGARLCRRWRERPPRLCQVRPRLARSGCVSAAVSVRSVVPLSCPQRQGCGAHGGGRAGSICGGGGEVRSARDGLDALVLALRAHGGTVSELVRDGGGDGDGRPGAAQLAAAGPRAAGAPGEYELLLEMILEGARLHYGPLRVVRT